MIELIDNEIKRDLTQRVAVSEAPTDSEEVEEQYEELEGADFSDDFDGDDEETENLDEDEDLDENEEQEEAEDMGM